MTAQRSNHRWTRQLCIGHNADSPEVHQPRGVDKTDREYSPDEHFYNEMAWYIKSLRCPLNGQMTFPSLPIPLHNQEYERGMGEEL